MSKPNLPPLPQMDVGVSGQVKFAYSQEALTAYAEEAVRQALAAQVPVAYLHTSNRTLTWPGKLNEVQLASGVWRALYEHQPASGHKPTPVDTSPGHSSPVAGEATYYAVMHGQAVFGIFETETAAGDCIAKALYPKVMSIRPLYAAPQASDRET